MFDTASNLRRGKTQMTVITREEEKGEEASSNARADRVKRDWGRH